MWATMWYTETVTSSQFQKSEKMVPRSSDERYTAVHLGGWLRRFASRVFLKLVEQSFFIPYLPGLLEQIRVVTLMKIKCRELDYLPNTIVFKLLWLSLTSTSLQAVTGDVPRRPHCWLPDVNYRRKRLKLVPDAASLRHEFRVSTGRKAILWRKMHAKWRNGGFLIDFLGFLPVETRNSCLSEASSVTTLRRKIVTNWPSGEFQIYFLPVETRNNLCFYETSSFFSFHEEKDEEEEAEEEED